MDKENFDADVDFLFPSRRRLDSDTCMSSYGPSMSSGALTSQQLFQPEQSSYPEFETSSLCNDLHKSSNDEFDTIE